MVIFISIFFLTQRIIMEQKELLDFYATMTGFMAWKERMQNDAESQECLVDFFKMKAQNSKLKGEYCLFS